MGQDVSDRDAFLAVLFEAGEVRRHFVVEPERAMFLQLVHHHAGDRLGRREQVDRRVEPERHRPIPIEALSGDDTASVADRPVQYDLAALADADLDSRVHSAAVHVLDERPHRVRLLARPGLLTVLRDDLEVGRCRAASGQEADCRVDPGERHGGTVHVAAWVARCSSDRTSHAVSGAAGPWRWR